VQIDLIHQTAVRWSDPDPTYVPLLADGGVTTVVLKSPNESFEAACRQAGIGTIGEPEIQFFTLPEAAKSTPGKPVVLKAGLWPGVQRPDPQTAGATHSLWLDQNCSLVNYIRALYPQVPPVLGYLPDQSAGVSKSFLLPYDAHELALVEACVSGGNYLIALHPRFRQGLLSGTADALAAWRRMGKTAKWLSANQALFCRPSLPIVTVLVDASDTSEEIAHLCYRQNVSPALVDAASPPAPDPSNRLVLAAVNIAAPTGNARRRILANAEAGTAVVVDGSGEHAWWRVPGLKLLRSDHERDYYALGKGQVVAYKESIDDPGMLALDLIDIVTEKRRPARVWNSHAALVMAAAGANPGTAMLKIINYSRPSEFPVLARIQGSYQRATLLRPESGVEQLKVSPRGSGSEVQIPRLERVAVVMFE
jgi:hypothetical protein